jgi:hypothetical protein
MKEQSKTNTWNQTVEEELMAKKAKKVARKKSAPKRKTTLKKSKDDSGRGKRYSGAQKASLLSKYRELRKGGLNAQMAANKVNVSYLTLRKWEKEAGLGKVGRLGSGKPANTGKRGRTESKNVTVTQTSGKLSLVTPKGYRIEGLSPKDLIQVLKAV